MKARCIIFYHAVMNRKIFSMTIKIFSPLMRLSCYIHRNPLRAGMVKRLVITGPVIRSMHTAIKPLNGSSQSRYCPNSRARIDIRHTGKKFNAMPRKRKNCGKIFVME
ncbi:MAG: hypothetical protein AVO38_10625 [delta proteobacterium ML8_D]|nr:MAG: hypothetical protein AVO38_10625 [delta proteobacterium ML8_D]